MNYVPTYSDLYDPAFPLSTLDTRVELLLGGVWTDVSKRAYFRDGVSVAYGHPDETSQVNPTRVSLTLKNGDGAFSPRNPTGPYYGLIGRNTPMRLSVPQGSVYLRMEDDAVSYASCPDRSTLDITGDLDVRIEIAPSNYATVVLACKAITASSQESWNLEMLADGQLNFVWTADGIPADIFAVVSTAPVPLGRIAVRATLAVATGTVTFYTAPSIGGTWTQLGLPGSGTGGAATSIFSSSAPVQIGNADLANRGFTGAVYGFQLRNGIGGTLVASPDFTAQVPGSAPFADAQGNVWSCTGTAQLSDRRYRAYTEVPAFPPQWDPTGQDVYAQIQGAGLLRRLTQGTPPTQSAMYRAYVRQTGSTAPVAYWPCEDGTEAASLASGLPSGSAMAIFGTPQLASSSAFACSQPIPVLNGARFAGAVPVAGTWNADIARLLVAFPSSLSSETDHEVIASFYTVGAIKRVDLQLGTAANGSLAVLGYDATNTLLFTSGTVAAPGGLSFGGTLMRVSFGLFLNGSTVDWEVDWVQVGGPANVVYGLTGSTGLTGALGAVTKVDVNPAGTCQQLAVGHVSVQQNDNSIGDLQDPLNAYLGEAAGTRFARLCAEQGVPCRIYGFPTDTVPMGYQLPGQFVPLLQECEDADRGLMFEPRQTLALGYRTRPSMFNQAAKLALVYTSAHLSQPLAPTDDDLLIQNDLTVTRNGGSSYRAALTTGALSTLAPPAGVGDYGQGVTVSLGSDGQLPDEAGWLLHMGTVDDMRYPSLTVDLARPELAGLYYQAQDVQVGDRVTASGTPGFLPPDGISQLVRGGMEVLYGFTFTEQWTCAPEAPYRVAVFDDPVLSRGDTDGSTLQGNYSAAAVTLLVVTTGAQPSSPLWTTSAPEFPFDIAVGGERMTVTNITGASSPQTFTVTRSVNGVVKPQTNGTDVRLFQPAILSM